MTLYVKYQLLFFLEAAMWIKYKINISQNL